MVKPTRQNAVLRPAVHRNELFPAMQALVRLWQQHRRPIIVQVAGIEGGEGSSSVAEALAEIVYGETQVGILLVTFDSHAETGAAPGDQLEIDHKIRRSPDDTDGDIGLIRARMHSSALRSAIAGRMDIGLDDLPPEIGLIILDTEPLLKSFEASAIGSQVDGVFLVVSAGKTSARDANTAIAAIANSGGRALGLIVNRRIYRAPRWLARLVGLPVSQLRDWLKSPEPTRWPDRGAPRDRMPWHSEPSEGAPPPAE